LSVPSSGRTLVVAGIVVDDLAAPQLVLATRRSRPAELAGRWEFPGGKVEPGEDPVAALRRELGEELDVAVRVGPELAPAAGGCWPISDRLEMRTWWVSISQGSPAPGDSHDAVRWCAPGALEQLDLLPADVPVAAALKRWLAEGRTAC
jgi:8-oxo-dGTP diphosphatase